MLKDKSGAPQCSADDRVGYENFRHVCHKWHYKITRSLVMCLSSKDYMQIRNALIILMRILPNYPVLQKLSKILERYVNTVIDEEKNKRQDLFVLARSYIGQLRNKANEMLKEADFHQVTEKKSSQESIKVVNGNSSSFAAKNHGKSLFGKSMFRCKTNKFIMQKQKSPPNELRKSQRQHCRLHHHRWQRIQIVR